MQLSGNRKLKEQFIHKLNDEEMLAKIIKAWEYDHTQWTCVYMGKNNWIPKSPNSRN